jgi:hypothetical protein
MDSRPPLRWLGRAFPVVRCSMPSIGDAESQIQDISAAGVPVRLRAPCDTRSVQIQHDSAGPVVLRFVSVSYGAAAAAPDATNAATVGPGTPLAPGLTVVGLPLCGGPGYLELVPQVATPLARLLLLSYT